MVNTLESALYRKIYYDLKKELTQEIESKFTTIIKEM